MRSKFWCDYSICIRMFFGKQIEMFKFALPAWLLGSFYWAILKISFFGRKLFWKSPKMTKFLSRTKHFWTRCNRRRFYFSCRLATYSRRFQTYRTTSRILRQHRRTRVREIWKLENNRWLKSLKRILNKVRTSNLNSIVKQRFFFVQTLSSNFILRCNPTTLEQISPKVILNSWSPEFVILSANTFPMTNPEIE